MLSTGFALKKQLFLTVNIRAGAWEILWMGLIMASYRHLVQKYQNEVASRIIRSIARVKLKPDRSRAA